MVQIFVKSPSGATLTVDVLETIDTGADLKVQIFERTGILPRFQWLSVAGRILEESHVLSDRGIGRESTVICHLRAGGGPCEYCSQKNAGARRRDSVL
jgi:hypothetical protein